MKKDAFTLSEVLLTLAIIGIISAITIPVLMNDTQDMEFKVAWKSAFSDLNQVMQKIKLDNGGILPDFSNSTQSFYPVFKDYVVINTECGYSLPSTSTCNYPKIKYLNGTYIDERYFDDGSAILNNGVVIFIENYSGWAPALIWADVNGAKPPNVIGKDVFGVTITRDGIKPFGSINDGHEGTCNTSSTGLGCSALYLYQ